jgi:nucleoside-diphosphate-sugar epimerase
MDRIALIVGVSGIVGNNLARHLLNNSWEVYGLARRPPEDIAGLKSISADLTDAKSLSTALRTIRPTSVFITAWMRYPTEEENIKVNSAMVRHLLEALSANYSVQHVALVTGLKHYLGPFEDYGKGNIPETPFRENQPRLNIPNFYYAQEDELFAAARRDGFSWNIHRPHTIIGYAVGNLMNMGVTLAVYASICREMDRPFIFPGSSTQWNSLTDMTDARLLARHLEWATLTKIAHNEAFNVVNGDVFRWRWMWKQIADWFGLHYQSFPAQEMPLVQQLVDDEPVWCRICNKYRLIEPNLNIVASPWHTDADLGRPIEVLTDMSKSRKSGFLDYQSTADSFFDLFNELRKSRVIP